MNKLHRSTDLKPHPMALKGLDFLAPDKNPTVNVDHSILLYVESLSVAFDGFQAINDLNLYITDGELRCIIGPNGARHIS